MKSLSLIVRNSGMHEHFRWVIDEETSKKLGIWEEYTPEDEQKTREFYPPKKGCNSFFGYTEEEIQGQIADAKYRKLQKSLFLDAAKLNDLIGAPNGKCYKLTITIDEEVDNE